MTSLFFITESSPKVGLGHLNRSLAIIDEILQNYKKIKIYLYVNKKTRLPLNINQKIITRSYGSKFDLFHKITTVTNLNKSCVIDTLNFNKTFFLLLNKYFNKIFALDYFFLSKPFPHAVINLINHNKKFILAAKQKNNNLNIYEGPKYAIIRDEFKAIERSKQSKLSCLSVLKILIVFGGSDPSNNTAKSLRKILKWDEKIEINVIIGSLNMHDYSNFKSKNITFITNPEKISIYFKSAQLIFCGGGTTLLESIYMNKATIVIPQTAREYRHANFYSQLNACYLYNKKLFHSKPDVNFINSIATNTKGLIDGYGKRRIAKIIMNDQKNG